MDCKKAEKFLVDYLYQELDPKKTVEIEKHLEICNGCGSTLQQWRAIRQGYQKTVSAIPSSPYLRQRILAAAREEAEREPRIFEKIMDLLRPVMIVPVTLIAFLVLLLTFGQEFSMKSEIPPSQTPRKMSQVRSKTPHETSEPSERQLPPASEEAEKITERTKEEEVPSRGLAGEYPEHIPAAKEELPAYEQEAPRIRQRSQDSLEQERKTTSSVATPQPVATPAPAEPTLQPTRAFSVAQSEFKKGNVGKGKELSDIAIRQDTSRELAYKYHQAGIEFLQNRQPQQAIVQFNLVLNHYPEYPQAADVLLRLGDAYFSIGQHQKALEAYQKLAEKYPSMKNIARQRIQELSRQKSATEQLKTLGYIEN